jgi:hypothetical protein
MDAFTLDGLDQRRRHAARCSELIEGQHIFMPLSLRLGGGDGGGEVGVDPSQAALDDPLDRREREALPLKGPNLADPLHVLRPIPGDPAFPPGRGEQALRLVVANGVDRHVTGRGDRFDPVPHDRQLYECSLEASRLGWQNREGGLQALE